MISKKPKSINKVLKIDLSTSEYTERLARAAIFAKKGEFKAQKVKEREEISTVLADGTVETVNWAEIGDMIVTNPDGERYILNSIEFGKRYRPTSQGSVYTSKGMIRAIVNPTGRPIEIMASWGDPQFGAADCIIATVYDEKCPDEIGSRRYIIGGQEFADTYAPVDEV